MYYYDTCALLTLQQKAFEDFFVISSVTLQELEHIKTSATKDEATKYKARKLIHLLDENEDKYKVDLFRADDPDTARYLAMLPEGTNDSKIIAQAQSYAIENFEHGVVFVTQDLCCKELAAAIGLSTIYLSASDEDSYTGYKEVDMNDKELADFYSDFDSIREDNVFELNLNEYLLVRHNGELLNEAYKWTENGLTHVHYLTFESQMFGSIKPLDIEQVCAMDSLYRNQITMLRGKAGSGKSFLAFSYLFSQLDKGRIDKIVVFCNTVATAGSARLGFYPGTKDEKLIDAQIGNLFASKLGDKEAVQALIDGHKLIFLPMSDIRGYDTSGMKAGVYITEAQNMDIELMKLALERVGNDCIMILDGDSDAQVDLAQYAGVNNGMRRVSEVFRGEDLYGEVTLRKVHRSRIAELAQLL